jgi:hypothetical protein
LLANPLFSILADQLLNMKPVLFTSPFTAKECIRRVEELAARKRLHISSGGFKTHVLFEAASIDGDTFTLFIRCNRYRFELPSFINFKLDGDITPAPDGSTIQLRMQLHGPITIGEWLYQIFWVFIILLSLTGSLIGILNRPRPQAYVVGLLLALGAIAYLGVLFQTYRTGKIQISRLLYQALQEEASTIGTGLHIEMSEWMSDLLDSNG